MKATGSERTSARAYRFVKEGTQHEHRKTSGARDLMRLPTLVLATLLILPLSAAATDYYVDKNRSGASDSNAGTEPAAPWATIGKCSSTLHAGDRCNVAAGGVYDERVTETTNGTAANRIVYRAIAGSPRPKVRAFTLSSASYITIEGFEITNQGMSSGSSDAFHSVYITGHNTGVSVLNNYIHHTNHSAVAHGSARFLTIRGNQISNVGTEVSMMGDHPAFAALYGEPNSDVLIEENSVSYTSDYLTAYGVRYVYRNNVLGPSSPNNPIHIDGIQANGVTSYSLMEGNVSVDNASPDNHFVLLHTEGSNGWIIRHNVTHRSKGMISLRYSDNNNVYNNTFVDNYDYYPSNYQVYAGENSQNNLFLNNIWYRSVAPGGGVYLVESGASINKDYDLVFGGGNPSEPHLVQGDPEFVNAAAGDFHIGSESPARDAGGPLTTVRSNDSGNGKVLFVTNAGVFQDGWAGTQPDWIAVGSADNVVQIRSINHNANSIVLASAVRRHAGDAVWLYKNSRGDQVLHETRPDIGAFEYIPSLFSIDQSNSAILYVGRWKDDVGKHFSNSTARIANTAGARATFSFVGESVKWISNRGERAGIARVYVDGALKTEIDLYRPASSIPEAVFVQGGLSWGPHTIAIEATGQKNPASKAAWIWLDGFEYGGSPFSSPLTTGESEIRGLTDAALPLSASGTVVPTAGFAELHPTPNAAPGLALLANRREGVLINETAIPASHLATQGRIFAEISPTVKTGLAIANPNEWDAIVSFYMTDRNGFQVAQGSVNLPAHSQLARFLDESPFNSPAELNGTLTFHSNSPVRAVVLRGFTNERSEFLAVALPTARLDVVRSAPLYIPHFADGAGWRTEFVLVNPTDFEISGNLELFDHGNPDFGDDFAVVAGVQSQIAYRVPARSSRSYFTTGNYGNARLGAAALRPANSDPAPAAFAMLSYSNDAGVTVGLTGVSAIEPENIFNVYVENSAADAIRTGLAVMNASGRSEQINFELLQMNGSPTGLSASVEAPPFSHAAFFLNEVPGFETIPASFNGVVRISSPTGSDIAVVGLRGHLNDRTDFVLSAIPALHRIEMAAPGIYVPDLSNGQGFTMKFITFTGSFDEHARNSQAR